MAPRHAVGLTGAVVVLLVLALVVAPGWPIHAAQSLLWFAGAWRALAVPLAVILLAALLAANTMRPGRAWSTGLAAIARMRPLLPSVAAVVIGLAAVAYAAGVLSGSALARMALLWLLQLALFHGTTTLLPLFLLALAVLAADRQKRPALRLAQCWWQRRPRAPERAIVAALPVISVAAVGALFAAAVFPDAMQGWARSDAPDARRYNFYSSFFNYAVSDDRIEERTGYELGKLGLVLPPGQSGSIVFRLERPLESLVLLKANFYNRRFDTQDAALAGQTFPNAIEVSTDAGRTYHPVLVDRSVGEVVGGEILDLTPAVASSRQYRLRFWAANTTDAEVTVLPSIVVSTVVDPLASPHPAFPIVPYVAAVAALVYGLGRSAGHARTQAVTGAFLAGATSAVLAAVTSQVGGRLLGEATGVGNGAGAAATLVDRAEASVIHYALPVMRAAVALVGLILAVVALRGRAHGRPIVVSWLLVACMLVGVVAVDTRWQQLVRVRYEFLLPDAQGYQAIAEAFPEKMARYEAQRPSALLDQLYASGFDGRANALAVFYAGGNNGREPLWPASIRLVFNVLGPSAFHTRLTSLGFGVLVAVLTCWLGWRLLHPLAGATAGLLVAFNRPHIVNSVAGLREELVTVLLLMLFGAIFVGARRGQADSWGRAGGAGLFAGAVVLVRADMLVMVGPIITLGAFALRWRWRRWLVALGVAGLLAGPMYIGYAFTHGDAFHPGTYGATVNRNLEFPERMGTPGFPSPEEYAANWAAGPSISPLQYFFGYHTPLQFAAYMVRGFIRIFPTIIFEHQPAQLWLFAAGVVLLLLRGRWFVPFALVISLVPFYAFLAGVPNPWVFPGRYAHHALPFAAMAAAYALWFLPGQVATIWHRRPLGVPRMVSGIGR